MGQQHSLPGKGMGIPSLVTSAADSNPDNHHPFSASPKAGQDLAALATPPTTVSNASSLGGDAEQPQSVRAVIDSFIETCLAGSDDGSPSRWSPSPKPSRGTPPNVEVITVPDEDESDSVSVDGVDKAQGGESGGEKDKNGIKVSDGQQLTDTAISEKVTDNASEKKTDSTAVSDTGMPLNEKLDKESLSPSLSVSVQKKEQTSDAIETSSDLGSKPLQKASGASRAAGNSGSGRDSNPPAHASEGSLNCMEGMESMRLKTFIDRMLDNSLGGARELSPVPSEKRVLAQITSEERTESTNLASQHGDKSRHSEAGSNSVGSDATRPSEPMAVCFMEHIEKAVERSFSSITEEEERKEKEKVRTGVTTMPTSRATEKENKNSTWNSRTSKASDSASSALSVGDGTISVQDIVDRVISQTEGVVKQPIPTRHLDSKPTVSASGTFYPDKASVDSPSQLQRRESQKEETSRETVGRRGRPRMRSPCPERREPVAAPEYQHSPREAARRGQGMVPGEDYLQSMQAALAKYGTVHPSHHRMAPFLPAAMPSSTSLTKGGLPVSAAQNSFMMSGLHASHASHPSLQSRLHGPQHASISSQPPPLLASAHAAMSSQPPPLHAPQHATMPSQPPPLLRVDVMERADLSGHGHAQPKPAPSHPPSRSCMCSACSMYWAHEREAERLRMVQQHRQQSPVERGLPRMPSHPSHPAYSKPMPSPSHSHKWPMENRHLETKQEKLHPYFPYSRGGQESYAASHPAYGIQTGVPVPQMAYADKQTPEVRHVEAHYPKPYDMGEYASRPTKTEPMVRETGALRHPYPTNMSSSKPPSAPSHSHPLPHAHHGAAAVTGGKADAPLLDLTCRRDPAPSLGEDEKPLDLSAKKPSSTMHCYERQDIRHHHESELRYDSSDAGMDHGIPAGVSVSPGRDGDKYMTASQHLHNLETSVETHFQKLQHAGHRGVPQHNNASLHMSASSTPQTFSAGMPPHGTSPMVPSQNFSVGRSQTNMGHGNGIPLPPHHPTLPPSHTGPAVGGTHPGYTSNLQPAPVYPPEPLLSPGGRRPQLHPIPPPNPSTTLGSAPPRSAPVFQNRTGGSSIPGSSAVPLGPGGSSVSLAGGGPAVMSAMPGASTSPMVSLPSSMPRATPPTVPMAGSSPHRSGSGGLPQFVSDYHRMSGSRSVSPSPGSERGGEERQRGNSMSKHEPIQSILGNNNPQDILYLICRLCRQTYGSPYGFRKHFRNQHGFEPKAEHALVQTISATKNARQMSGGRTPTLDPESPSQDGHTHPSRTPTVDGVGYPAHPASPRSDMARPMTVASPVSASCESVGDVHSAEGQNAAEHRRHNSSSRTSTDSKGRSPSGEEREDTKCLECPECGQTFQLNDFGSYKRHCRQHSQMKGVGREGSSTQGVYSCAECQCSYADPQQLQEHVQRHHANATPITCPLCRTSLSCSAAYQDHMRVVHKSSSQEATSSSLPVTISDKAKVSSASSHCDISSSSSAVRRETPSTTLTNSVTSFNLTVTTPSDLEICRLPADPIVTSASPDSSSDNKKAQDNTSDGKKAQDSSPVSSSEQVKLEMLKTESASLDSPKSGSSEGTESARTATDGKENIKTETDNKQVDSEGNNSKCNPASIGGSSNSSLDADENADLFMYKHKKFSAHRKRSASSVSEGSASEAKQSCLDGNSGKTENVVSSATEKQQTKGQEPKSKTGTEGKQKTTPLKTEARHPLPFVWDRVTRSQAGKNTRSSDYS